MELSVLVVNPLILLGLFSPDQYYFKPDKLTPVFVEANVWYGSFSGYFPSFPGAYSCLMAS